MVENRIMQPMMRCKKMGIDWVSTGQPGTALVSRLIRLMINRVFYRLT